MSLGAKQVLGILMSVKKSLDKKIDDAVVHMYTPGGSLTFNELPQLSAEFLGYAYVVTDDFTTDSRFVEGVGEQYPGGTTVAVVDTGAAGNPNYKFDATVGAIPVDEELDIDSKNPVENKVVTSKFEEVDDFMSDTLSSLADLDDFRHDTETDIYNMKGDIQDLERDKQDVLTFDEYPQQYSENPIMSGGVYDALTEKIDLSNTPGLVKNDGTIDQTVYEKSGVAETLVKDTVGWSGKNKWSYGNITTATESDIPLSLSAGTYTLSGVKSANNIELTIRFNYIDETSKLCSNINANGETITFDKDVVSFNFSVAGFSSGDTITNIQLEAGSSTTSFEPYHATVDTVKADKVTNATPGNLAGLDSNGNLTDSGVSPTEDVTVEGNPVTFESPFEQDAKSVVVSVKPIQDLHGYDHPWVGGARKNKANIADAQIQTADYIYEDVAINDIGGLNAGTYTISFDVSDFSEGSLSQAILLNSDGTQTESIYISLNNGRCSGVITTNFVATKMTIYSNSPTGCKCKNVQIEAGSTPTTFAPYSNICPISGIDKVEIGVSGENIWDEQYVQGDFDSTTGEVVSGTYMCSKNPIPVKPNTTYTIWCNRVNPGNYYYCEYDSNGNFVYFSGKYNGVPFTTASNARYIKFQYGGTYGYPYTDDIIVSEGSEHPTAYEPYTGHTTTLPLPSTLYGGEVDVTEGTDTPTYGMVDLANLNWTAGNPYYTSNDIASTVKIPAQSVKPNAMAEEHNVVARINIDNAGDLAINTDGVIYARTSTRPSGKLVYELATPTTISLTPTDVELLEGTNVVTTNGEKVAVTYKAGILATLGDIDDLNDKVKTKLDKKDVAKVEGANASKPYAVGDYMLRSDGFHVVTQPIAQNAPITSNNTDKTTVGNELSNKVDTDDSRLSDSRTPVAHTHNISDITGIPAWTKLGEVTGTSPDYENSSTFNLSALQNKDVLMIFSVDEGTLTAKQGIITLEYSAFEFGKILEDSVQEEDEITRLWKGFYGGAPRESVATFEEFLRGLGYIYIATHSTTAEIGAKIYGAYDWTLEIYTK